MSTSASTCPASETTAPRRHHHVFLWIFLAIQALFLLWLIVGVASAGSGIHPDAVAQCHHQAASMGQTQAQCVHMLGGASKAGAAIGAGLIVVLWVFADIIIGGTYGICRLATRGRTS